MVPIHDFNARLRKASQPAATEAPAAAGRIETAESAATFNYLQIAGLAQLDLLMTPDLVNKRALYIPVENLMGRNMLFYLHVTCMGSREGDTLKERLEEMNGSQAFLITTVFFKVESNL